MIDKKIISLAFFMNGLAFLSNIIKPNWFTFYVNGLFIVLSFYFFIVYCKEFGGGSS